MHDFACLLALFHAKSGALDLADTTRDWIDFIGIFCMIGAVSFRALVVGRVARWDRGGMDAAPRTAAFRAAAANAAVAGFLGTVLVASAFTGDLLDVGGRIPHWMLVTLWLGLGVSAAGFVGARLTAHHGARVGWYVATLGVAFIVGNGVVAPLIAGRWLGAVNPLHVAFGAMWLGTLGVLVAAGLPAVLRCGIAHAYRGPLVADFVFAFSPVALASAALLALTGTVTAWRHLKHVSALWTTPYGETLLVKLCLVAVVVGLGAWNWRRVRPLLGNEPAAHALRRSAGIELLFGAVVLAVTAVLVNLPAPKG